jgi:hypothetical protein
MIYQRGISGNQNARKTTMFFMSIPTIFLSAAMRKIAPALAGQVEMLDLDAAQNCRHMM